MVEQLAFRDAMARLAAAVNIITTDGAGGRAGFTATAVCSVTDEPPTLLVCMNRASRGYPIFVANGALCVNVLEGGQAELSKSFATSGRDFDTRFNEASWSQLETGSPALQGASASLDCLIESVTEVGTHGIFMCRVVSLLQERQASALLWFQRSYVRVSPPLRTSP